MQGGPKKDQSDFEIIFLWKNYVIEINTVKGTKNFYTKSVVEDDCFLFGHVSCL